MMLHILFVFNRYTIFTHSFGLHTALVIDLDCQHVMFILSSIFSTVREIESAEPTLKALVSHTKKSKNLLIRMGRINDSRYI